MTVILYREQREERIINSTPAAAGRSKGSHVSSIGEFCFC